MAGGVMPAKKSPAKRPIPSVPLPMSTPPAAQIRIRSLVRRLNQALAEGMQWEERVYERDEEIAHLKAELEKAKEPGA